MTSEDRAKGRRGFAGLKSMVSQLDLVELLAQSDRAANDPDPSSGVRSIRSRHLGRWLAIAALIVYVGWLALR